MVKKKRSWFVPIHLITMEYLIKDYYSAYEEYSQGKYIVLGGKSKLYIIEQQLYNFIYILRMYMKIIFRIYRQVKNFGI